MLTRVARANGMAFPRHPHPPLPRRAGQVGSGVAAGCDLTAPCETTRTGAMPALHGWDWPL
eukprot:191538-Alexandrium_andersonii.AAC.1